jgi:opacity protein-like surface antigen
MKKLLLLLIPLLPSIIFSQTPDSSGTRKFAIGLVFSPDYCYRTLKPDGAAMSQYIAKNRDSTELPRIGFTTGLSFLYQLKKRFTLESGLLFSDNGEQTKNTALIFGTGLNGQPGVSDPVTNKFIYHYKYLDIPLKVNYALLTKRLSIFLSGGLSANFFITETNTSIQTYSDGHTTTSSSTSRSGSGLSALNLAFVAGAGVSYNLSGKLALRVEPVYRRSITSIIDAPVKGYLYSAGLNMGIYYRF